MHKIVPRREPSTKPRVESLRDSIATVRAAYDPAAANTLGSKTLRRGYVIISSAVLCVACAAILGVALVRRHEAEFVAMLLAVALASWVGLVKISQGVRTRDHQIKVVTWVPGSSLLREGGSWRRRAITRLEILFRVRNAQYQAGAMEPSPYQIASPSLTWPNTSAAQEHRL